MLLFFLIKRLKDKPTEIVCHLLEIHADEVYGSCWLKSLHFTHNDRSIVLFHLSIDNLFENLLVFLRLSYFLLKLFLRMILIVVLDGNYDLKLLIAGNRKIRILPIVLFVIFRLADIRVFLDVFVLIF